MSLEVLALRSAGTGVLVSPELALCAACKRGLTSPEVLARRLLRTGVWLSSEELALRTA